MFLNKCALFIVILAFQSSECQDTNERLKALEEQVKSLKEELNVCKASGLTRQKSGLPAGSFVAFSSTIYGDITPVASYEIIVYDRVNLNIGNGYDKNVGRFQAPVSGVYHFVATIMSYSSNSIEIELMHDGNALCRARASETNSATGTCVANIQLSVGSDVWVRHYSNHGNYIKGSMFSAFTGHLIHSS